WGGAAVSARVTRAPPAERTPERPNLAPSVVDPERFTSAAGEPCPGLTPSVSRRTLCPAAAFQSALPPAVLLPESFRGGCSFGAARSEVKSGRDLSCGRAYGAPCVPPRTGGSQPLPASASARIRSCPDLPSRLHSLVQHPHD